MEKTLIDASGAAEALRRFADARDWRQFHSPKNLAMALAGEVGELTAIFQWMTEDESHHAGSAAATAQAVRDELADVAMYLVRLCDVLGGGCLDLPVVSSRRSRSAATQKREHCP